MSGSSKNKTKKKKRKPHFRVYEYDDRSIVVIKDEKTAKQFAALSDAESFLKTGKKHNYTFPVGLETFYYKNRKQLKKSNTMLESLDLSANTDLQSQSL